MATFTWTPSVGANLSMRPTVRRVAFGDGYEQRSEPGLNARRNRVTLVWPVLEKASIFPRRINVHFVQVHGPGEVTMRTWERGSGITLACGTGASAVCVSGALTGRHGRKILAHLPGGDLELNWADNDRVYMTGEAVEVFNGEVQGL